MLQAVLTVIAVAPEGVQAKNVISQVREILPPTADEAGVYETTGLPKYDKILRFATIGTVKAGWMVKSKGVWTITDDGRDALMKFSDPRQLMVQVNRMYATWKQGNVSSLDTSTTAIAVADVGTTPEEAEEQSWQDVSNFLAVMPPYDFQELVAALLRAMNYHVSWIAPPGRDGGVDIIAYVDPLGAKGPRVKVQVKRRADKVGVVELRSFLAVVSERDVGVYVALGGFSPDAIALVNQEQTRRMTLINGQRFFDLWIEHLGEMASEDKERLPLKPVYFLDVAPSELGE